ncbi:unnamed protein product [Clonostachys byssicola]|uniref:O-methyltransferase domain-containing protein n=1 Tax=Clonostachys byssicola TaxID=160290 RepID=A0A9N9YDM2_9HYPO|nr:unnamed protein product [Clonostachys byssicola]
MAPSDIVERMQAAATALANNEIGSRETLLSLNRELLAELETPSEFLQRVYFATHSLSGCLEIAVNTQLFQHVRDAGEGISTDALAEKTGITAPVLVRMMRHFVANSIVKFSKSKGWQSTELSKTLAAENYQHSILFCQRAAATSFKGFPEHFKAASYKPPGLTDGPFQSAHKTDLPFFHWLGATPPFVDYFASFMSVYRAGQLDWWQFYPVAERLTEGFDKAVSENFVVDVGGGRGHDLMSFANGINAAPGKLVLQDQPDVVASVEKTDLFEIQAHDFYTPQPVKSARVYFLHSILHDWSDKDGVRILQNLKPALTPGYSRVLLNEIVLSEEKPSVPATSMDMMMLGHFGESRERSTEEWTAIVTEAGFEIANIYSNPASPESVVELSLRSE